MTQKLTHTIINEKQYAAQEVGHFSILGLWQVNHSICEHQWEKKLISSEA